MPMPASGSIAIISAPQTCGSICASVGQTTGSLLALGADACKAPNVCIRSFYSYAGPATYHAIGFCNISATGTNGTASRCTVDCICSNVAMVVGQCYTINLCHSICSNTNTGSRAHVEVICGGTRLYCCIVSNGGTACNFTCSFTVNGSNSLCFIACALHPVAGGTCCSCARTCITSISNASPAFGLFCKGATSCTDCTVYACP